MDNQSLLDDPNPGARKNKDAIMGPAAPRRQHHMEMPYGEVVDEPGPSVILDYLQIVRRRKATLMLVSFFGLLVAVLFTVPQRPVYQARGSIEIQSLNENFLNMRNVNLTSNDESLEAPGSNLATEAKILQSDSLLERVATKLDLAKRIYSEEESGRLAVWRKSLGLRTGVRTPTREQVLTLVSKNLKVTMEPNTRLVEIQYDSTDPELAATFVNGLASEFIQQNLESHWQISQQTGEWLTRQLEDVKTKLEKSEGELQEFASASGLVFTSETNNVADEKLRQLQEELSKAHADRVAAQSKYELASESTKESVQSQDSLPEVLDDATLKDYQVKLTDLRRQLAEVSSSLTPAHPEVKKIQAQITTLELACDTERASILQRMGDEFQSARRRESLLAANYNSQATLISEQATNVAHYNNLKREVDTNRQLYDSLLQNVQQAGMASALGASNARVVDSAVPPSHPYRPDLVVNSALGLLAGAFLGVPLVVIQETADRTIRVPGQASAYLEVPELGAIPSASAAENPLFAYYHKGGGSKRVDAKIDQAPIEVELAISKPRPSVLADAFRAALTSLLFCDDNGNRPRVIVVTSANPQEGKTTVACNLALAMAETGRSVLLIDSDLRKQRLHEIFGVSNEWGFSDFLGGRSTEQDCEVLVSKTAFKNLSLLPSGSAPSNISGLLHSQLAIDLFKRMRREFDAVFIDTPPMLLMPDARVLGRVADGVVLVVDSTQTARDTALAAKERLEDDGTRVLGTILNRWDLQTVRQYNRGHRYHL